MKEKTGYNLYKEQEKNFENFSRKLLFKQKFKFKRKYKKKRNKLKAEKEVLEKQCRLKRLY